MRESDGPKVRQGTQGTRKETEPNTPITCSALAPSGWSEAGRRLRAARLLEGAPDPVELGSLVVAFAAARAPLRERATGRLDLAAVTLDVYRREAARFASWATSAGVTLRALSTEELRAYAAGRLSAGERTSTVRRALGVARMTLRALRWTGLSVELPDSPRLRDTERPEERRPAPAWGDFARAAGDLVTAAQGSGDWRRLRLAAAVLLAGTAGLRASELVGLRWRDLDDVRGVLFIRRGKGGRSRRVPVTADLVAVLAELRRSTPTPADDAPVLCSRFALPLSRVSLWKALAGWETAVGLGGARGVHVLRHVAGTRAARAGGIEAARDLLGHSRTATTETYSKRAEAEELRTKLAGALSVLDAGGVA